MAYYLGEDSHFYENGGTSKQLILYYLKNKKKDVNPYDMIPERYRRPDYIVTKFNNIIGKDVGR